MKKKKPKKSPSKSPAKWPPKAPSKADSFSPETDLVPGAVETVLDAQSDSPVDMEAQQSHDAPDLGLARSEIPPCLTVIDATVSDPPSTTHVPPSNAWKSSTDGIPQSPSMWDKEERPASVPVGTTHSDNADAKIVSLSSHSVPETPENQVSVVPNPLETLAVQSLSDGDQNLAKEISVEEGKKDSTPPPKAVKQNPAPKTTPVNDWCNLAKGLGKRLSKKGEAFTLPSGEACIKIPNSVIEKNMKSWEPFVLGQFYSDPPS